MSLQTIFQIVLMFFVLVTIHEWGHYYFAKRAGILVREFAIGFGPKLFSFRRGETRYTLRLLPIGGFVRMAGEDPEIVQVQNGQTIAVDVRDGVVRSIYLDQLDTRVGAERGEVVYLDLERDLKLRLDTDGEVRTFDIAPDAVMVARGRETQIAPWDRQFGSKTVGQRALAIFAGPLMNFILAFLLFMLVMVLAGLPENLKLNSVSSGSPADQSGLRSGDIVAAVDGHEIGGDHQKLTQLIQQAEGRPMTWRVIRDGEPVDLSVTPKRDADGRVVVGIQLSAVGKRTPNALEVVQGGWDSMVYSTKQILTGFKMLVTGQFTLDDLSGPVGTIQVTAEQAEKGIVDYTFWAGILSLYLGIFNLLPFPALDGSRLVFLGLEAIRGRPVDPSRESMVHFVGFAMLMLLMIAVTYNDILKLVR
ncbi:RIP metalloprotease RseP [Paenibacillus thermoaerophilus]|uniref:Zinc metalloprotease n=1 Tax=Paenibacillus thermoaerophilus TaxID=1215385 RepID=A0ABW2V0T7_9BACL|nr:RIP metalloprotease RseP [Paenibacillus thermoaerophilus]TMV13831.1 RIP metalloprotease RseP [Paenibacillus thermoaerophilus]